MHENVLSRKIETTTPYMSMNMHFNMTKGSYFTQIYKNDLVNDHTEQKVSSSDGSGNNLNRYRSYDFKPLHAENTSKRFSMNEQTAFDIAPNIIKSGFMDTTNRGYAAKNFISPFSKKPAGVGQNSFTSFVSDQYDVMRTQTSHTKRADSFNCKLSMTTIPLRISNEHSRSGRYNSQDWIVSGHEYMKRLLQAHQVVDELLKARGLISNNEVDYLYSWDQKMNREPKTKEQNILDVYGPVACKNAGGLDISGVSQLRSTSMSLGGDSENDSRDSPKLQERNSQNFMFTVLTSEKQGTGSIESVAKRRQIEEESTKLQKYEEKRQVEREREEEELRKLKEKKERRKLEREEEERQLQERLTQKERKRKQEEEERKAKIEAEKLKKDNERRKRQQMLSSQRNFVLPEKSDRTDKFGNIVQAKQEMSMTKEQQEEAKRNYLVYVKHTMEFGKNGPKELREKIRQIHQRICKLEADKYDLEKRHERQEYDLRELNERQRQVARNKAFKKGLHPADTNSIHPPKVSIISKYDRQIDRRNFRERRAMFENKTAYPCFPNVLPPPTLYEKIILCDDKPDVCSFAFYLLFTYFFKLFLKDILKYCILI
uniref:Bm2203, isoform a n=1 Tax=Brugia malayi TaxID=6279 RepID=A0A1I9G1L9_BRUMA|nr:Bm2203, isoform a [Brugia malayi]